ncbi:DNA polymerase III subunit alpha, partial [Vibrio vulnificus]
MTLLISKAYLRGHVQHQPVIDKEWLIELSEGLIILSGARNGEIGKALLKGNQKLVESCVAFYQQHFADRFYLELIRTGRSDEETYLHFAIELAEQYDLPVVATNEVVFIGQELFDAHEIRVAIHDGYTLEDP